MAGSFVAASTTDSSGASAFTTIVPRSLPLIWTATVTVSNEVYASSQTGHLWEKTEGSCPVRCQSSSARCGANGAIKIKNVSTVSLSGASFIEVTSFVNSINELTMVFMRNVSRRSVTFFTSKCRWMSICLEDELVHWPLYIQTQCQARLRNRCTPSIPRLLHSASSSGGPTNNSYMRSESQPKSRTSPSGVTTFPFDLDIFSAFPLLPMYVIIP